MSWTLELTRDIEELSKKAIGLVALDISMLSILKLDLKRALIRYLSLAVEDVLHEILMSFSPDILKVVEVNSSKF